MNAESFWTGRRVAITGHTGFKGAWLAHWLLQLGATVNGYALAPPTQPHLFGILRLAERMRHTEGDIRDAAAFRTFLASSGPEIVFHLASEALVRRSYAEPERTFDVNVMGLVRVFEAMRATPGIRAAVIVTSDKCYENTDLDEAFTEDARLGGRDPYSSSKACAELVTAAYRASFFSAPGTPAIATARAGNVIGGGDWADDRLIPDLVRAAAAGRGARIRRPHAVRPWQHVFEPLGGYLTLAEALVESGRRFEGAWNFGPDAGDARTVGQIATRFAAAAGLPRWEIDGHSGPHEAAFLRVDAQKARRELGWRPRIDVDTAVDWTAQWYRAYREGDSMAAFCDRQLADYALAVQAHAA